MRRRLQQFTPHAQVPIDAVVCGNNKDEACTLGAYEIGIAAGESLAAGNGQCRAPAAVPPVPCLACGTPPRMRYCSALRSAPRALTSSQLLPNCLTCSFCSQRQRRGLLRAHHPVRQQPHGCAAATLDPATRCPWPCCCQPPAAPAACASPSLLPACAPTPCTLSPPHRAGLPHAPNKPDVSVQADTLETLVIKWNTPNKWTGLSYSYRVWNTAGDVRGCWRAVAGGWFVCRGWSGGACTARPA